MFIEEEMGQNQSFGLEHATGHAMLLEELGFEHLCFKFWDCSDLDLNFVFLVCLFKMKCGTTGSVFTIILHPPKIHFGQPYT